MTLGGYAQYLTLNFLKLRNAVVHCTNLRWTNEPNIVLVHEEHDISALHSQQTQRQRDYEDNVASSFLI
jgi:hypothetical protein